MKYDSGNAPQGIGNSVATPPYQVIYKGASLSEEIELIQVDDEVTRLTLKALSENFITEEGLSDEDDLIYDLEELMLVGWDE